MPETFEDRSLSTRHRYGSFIERYPDYPSWLDGRLWSMDIETEIENQEPLRNFRSSLHYQARVFGLRLVTATETRDGRRYFLVQAFPRDEPQ